MNRDAERRARREAERREKYLALRRRKTPPPLHADSLPHEILASLLASLKRQRGERVSKQEAEKMTAFFPDTYYFRGLFSPTSNEYMGEDALVALDDAAFNLNSQYEQIVNHIQIHKCDVSRDDQFMIMNVIKTDAPDEYRFQTAMTLYDGEKWGAGFAFKFCTLKDENSVVGYETPDDGAEHVLSVKIAIRGIALLLKEGPLRYRDPNRPGSKWPDKPKVVEHKMAPEMPFDVVAVNKPSYISVQDEPRPARMPPSTPGTPKSGHMRRHFKTGLKTIVVKGGPVPKPHVVKLAAPLTEKE